MEIILAVVVVAAVLFFGALISAGNERQRKAIDGLREQVILWAMQDLRIKREHLAREVKVDDPLGWLNRQVAKLVGVELGLQVSEFLETPPTLICVSGDGSRKVLFSSVSPDQLRRLRQERRSRLSQYDGQVPLLGLPRGVETYELSVLNGGMLFDLELPQAWKALTGHAHDGAGCLWVYVIS
jgi:hypothetical protein